MSKVSTHDLLPSALSLAATQIASSLPFFQGEKHFDRADRLTALPSRGKWIEGAVFTVPNHDRQDNGLMQSQRIKVKELHSQTAELKRQRSSQHVALTSVKKGAPLIGDQLPLRKSFAKKSVTSIPEGEIEFDLLRNSEGTGLIAGPRNDENVIVAGPDAAFLKFHNIQNDRSSPVGRVGS